MEEMFKFVVDAVVNVTIVVLANGMESAEDAGAEKEMVGEEPTAYPEPVTEIPVPLVKVEVATDESAALPLPYNN